MALIASCDEGLAAFVEIIMEISAIDAPDHTFPGFGDPCLQRWPSAHQRTA